MSRRSRYEEDDDDEDESDSDSNTPPQTPPDIKLLQGELERKRKLIYSNEEYVAEIDKKSTAPLTKNIVDTKTGAIKPQRKSDASKAADTVTQPADEKQNSTKSKAPRSSLRGKTKKTKPKEAGKIFKALSDPITYHKPDSKRDAELKQELFVKVEETLTNLQKQPSATDTISMTAATAEQKIDATTLEQKPDATNDQIKSEVEIRGKPEKQAAKDFEKTGSELLSAIDRGGTTKRAEKSTTAKKAPDQVIDEEQITTEAKIRSQSRSPRPSFETLQKLEALEYKPSTATTSIADAKGQSQIGTKDKNKQSEKKDSVKKDNILTVDGADTKDTADTISAASTTRDEVIKKCKHKKDNKIEEQTIDDSRITVKNKNKRKSDVVTEDSTIAEIKKRSEKRSKNASDQKKQAEKVKKADDGCEIRLTPTPKRSKSKSAPIDQSKIDEIKSKKSDKTKTKNLEESQMTEKPTSRKNDNVAEESKIKESKTKQTDKPLNTKLEESQIVEYPIKQSKKEPESKIDQSQVPEKPKSKRKKEKKKSK